MSTEARRLFDLAIRLSPRARADLAALLIRSLDREEDPDASEAWEKELDRRLAQIESGRAEWISWETLRRRLKGGKRSANAR